MTKEIIILSFLLTVLVSCNQATNKKTSNSVTSSLTTEMEETTNQDIKTIKLDFDFIVSVGQEEDFEKFKTYKYFRLTRNNTPIFIDSSLTEYEFGNKLFPIIIKTSDNSFELLFEINDRPNKNYLKRLFIKVSASPKIGQKEVVKITNFNNFKDKLRDEKEIHRITNCISH